MHLRFAYPLKLIKGSWPYSLLTTHYSLLTTHYSLLTTHYSLLTTHYSLLTTHLLPLAYSSRQGAEQRYVADLEFRPWRWGCLPGAEIGRLARLASRWVP